MKNTTTLLKKISSPAIIVPSILFFILIVLIIIHQLLVQQVQSETLVSSPIADITTSSLPFLTQKESFALTAEAAVVMDADSKVVLFTKNPLLQFSPASTTKIMSALVALEHFKLDDIFTIKTQFTQPVIIGFKKGQQITLENLLYGMMLPSANDATQAVADNYPGGERAFVAEMNKKAQELHLYHTHFADPIGLEDDSDYTTVLDLAQLASIAMQNPEFAKIVGTKYYTLKTIDGMSVPIKNINELLGLYGVDGVKTGYTDEAKQVLVTSVMRDGHRLIIVVMKSDDRFADTRVLINAITNNLTYSSTHL
jgi:D-alanyl-D-alanine carboxypeptidase (penicillin-binding protein 5/6)